MHIKILIASILLSPSLSYANTEVGMDKNEDIFIHEFKKHLNKNEHYSKQVDHIEIICTNKYLCTAVSFENNKAFISYEMTTYFKQNNEIDYIELTAKHLNGSFIYKDILFNANTLIRKKRGTFFKPSIDGSWLANERALLLKHARKTENERIKLLKLSRTNNP